MELNITAYEWFESLSQLITLPAGFLLLFP